ncbi:MAG: hypothetical protein LBQ30_04880 [Treponema sp.]|jgi:hypothetical protein|nr:hypothetical protein [Treponema sp.]
MKHFVCAFEDILLGIPVAVVAEIIQVPWKVQEMIAVNPPTGEVFCSLPWFFGRADLPAPHGVRFKPLAYPETLFRAINAYGGTEGSGIVIITTSIETELDIPDAAIRQLPGFMGKLPFLKGVSFSGPTMTAFIDPVALVSRMLGPRGGAS